MSEAAIRARARLQARARGGGASDARRALVRNGLPLAMGGLLAVLVLAPLSVDKELSFLLAKDNVARAGERLRVDQALYRGEDGKGQPFTLSAASAVQKSSRVPVVELTRMAASIRLPDGPAQLEAAAAAYDMDREIVSSDGAIRFSAADGYSLAANGVDVDLKSRRMVSDRGVSGTLPIGSFSARSIRADLESRTVILEGGVRMRITQGLK